jgi:hypothetical protein
MINSTAWIYLPVGENLDDHVNVSVLFYPHVVLFLFAKIHRPIPLFLIQM